MVAFAIYIIYWLIRPCTENWSISWVNRMHDIITFEAAFKGFTWYFQFPNVRTEGLLNFRKTWKLNFDTVNKQNDEVFKVWLPANNASFLEAVTKGPCENKLFPDTGNSHGRSHHGKIDIEHFLCEALSANKIHSLPFGVCSKKELFNFKQQLTPVIYTGCPKEKISTFD